MQATATTATLVGLDARPVRVEVDSGRGPAFFHMVGLAEAAVRESRVRVRAALGQIGIDLGEYVLTVSLAPADVRKSGSAFDLAIAAAILAALGRVPAEPLEGTMLLGELSLSGAIQPVKGVLPALLGARRHGFRRAVVPRANEGEAGVIRGLEVLVAERLQDLCRFFTGECPLPLARPLAAEGGGRATTAALDLAEVRGQQGARRALEIAAAGGHNLLLVGPPGGGKTMLARRLPTILPPLTFDETLTVSAIHSVAGLLDPSRGLVRERPFRAPHHTISTVGLVGGGDPVRPGEVSLAHAGALFLDELCEYRRITLESLRQPLEDGEVTICRARARATFPARPLLIAAANPCPCGFAGSQRCTCTHDRIRAYRSRLSGPLLERIDLHVELPPVDLAALHGGSSGESSSEVRARVVQARGVQLDRAARGETQAPTNGELGAMDLEQVATPDAAGRALLGASLERLNLSARAYGKVLRVARTLADLEGEDGVRARHVAEAVQLRVLDRGAQGVASRSLRLA